MVRVFLGLGSNLAHREANLREALVRLSAGVVIEVVSSCYETDPVGYLDQPSFINIACSGTTDLAPGDLLAFVKSIEAQMGREPTFRNGPRLIDIDILSYGDLVLETEELTVPHPRIYERAFVLAPLSEIAPGWTHPVLGRTASEMAAATDSSGVRLLARTGG